MTTADQDEGVGGRGRGRSFSLVELLVVIAIIALLIGLLIPGLWAARKRAQQMKCLANNAAIGKADAVFANDHQEYYPGCSGAKPDWTPAFSGNFSDYVWGNIPAWPVQLGAYLNSNQQVFQCPAAPRDVARGARYNDYFLAINGSELLTNAAGQNICYALNRNRIAFSTAYIMGGDCTFWEWDNDDLDISDLGNPNYHCLSFPDDLGMAQAAGLGDAIYGPYHFGGVNVLYGDGHAAFASAFDLATMTFDPDRMSR